MLADLTGAAGVGPGLAPGGVDKAEVRPYCDCRTEPRPAGAMRRIVCGFLLILLPTWARAQSALNATVTIGRVDSLWSATLKEQRKLLVYTPPSYGDTTYTPQKYPVLYLLDGDAHFHSVTGLLQILGTGVNGTFVVPEMIVVAIPNTDRTRDLTPTHVEKDLEGKPAPFLKTSGGMGNFFRFLTAELIPRIDSAFRTAPYRVFVGHSLGGITTINALYTIPEAFNAYVAIDPSLWYDDRLLLKQAKDYFSRPRPPNRALFVGQANTINADDSTTRNVHFSSIVQFNSILETYNRSGVRFEYKYYPADDHGSVPLIATYDALRFIFAGYRLDLAQGMQRPAYLTEHFARVSDLFGYRVAPPERMVDMLGHFALMRDTTNAITLFQLNAELYPASPKAYEGLGDGWMAKGDFKQAIAFYEKSLALRPGNERARGMIRRMKEGKP
jgi:predicted alpha/beta superfamily hydrolase